MKVVVVGATGNAGTSLLGALARDDEVVMRDVRGGELRLRERDLRETAREAENRVDPGILRKRVEQARADVPRRADDDDSRHFAPTIPSSSTSVKKAAAYGDSFVRSRTYPQSTCSRIGRAIWTTLS